MPPDAERETRDRTGPDDYVLLRVDRLRVTRWRIRVGFAVVPLAWLLMGDTPAFVIACLGACTLALIMVAGSALARFDEHVQRLTRATRRWR